MMKVSNMLNSLRTSLWPQWLAATEVLLLSMMVGMADGWTSPFIGNLSKSNPPFEVTKEQIVWVASLVNLSRPIGVVVGSVISSLGGSKLTLYICGFGFLSSGICLFCADTIKIVFISLIFNGTSQGIMFTIFPLYIGEISDPKIRGKLVCFVIQGEMIGYFLGSTMGAYLAPWVYAAINLVPSVFFVITFSLFPHTPHYLIRCGKREEAANSIQWYNRNADVSSELKCLSDFFAANPILTFSQTLRKLNTPVNRKTLLTMNIVYSFVHLTGLSTIYLYMEVLFTDAKINLIAPSSLVIVMGVISIISSWVAVCIIGKFGRTTILLVSCIFLSIALFGWGLNYHLLDVGFDEPNIQWLTIVSSTLYRVNIAIGILTIVPAIMSEIFAPDVKNMAVCICNITDGLFAFISNIYFQFMVDHLTHKYVFYLIAVHIVFIGIYSKIVIPETKGKSLAEIQAMINKEKPEKSSQVSKV